MRVFLASFCLLSFFFSSAFAASSVADRVPPGSSSSLFDLFVQQGVPKKQLREAFQYFDAHSSQILNRKRLVLVDFAKALNEPRFYILNLEKGTVSKTEVSHGLGSDPNASGKAVRFSDANGSNASSIGFYLTMAPYRGEYGYSLRLRGLSETNRHAFQRTIVIHGYPIGPTYDRAACRREKVAAGRPQSQRHCLAQGALTRGCFGLPRPVINSVVDQLAGGALLYAFH